MGSGSGVLADSAPIIAAIGAVLVLVAVTVQWLDRQIAHRRGANDPERSFDESDA